MKSEKLQGKIKKLFLLLTGITTALIVGLFLKAADVKAQYTCDCYCWDQIFGLKNLNSTDALADLQAIKICDTACQNAGIQAGGEVTNCKLSSTEQAVCESDAFCKTGMECKNGICVTKSCTNVNDCPSDFTCTSNQCIEVHTKKKCKTNDGCPKLYLCSLGECTKFEGQITETKCTGQDPKECPTGMTCVDSICVVTAGGQECTVDEECPQGYICHSSLGSSTGKVCKPGCLTDADCKPDEKCQEKQEGGTSNFCRKKTCPDEIQCKSGEKCVYGSCEKSGEAKEEIPHVPAGEAELKNPLGDINLINLIGKRIIPGLLGCIGAIAVVAIIWGGFTYVISRGNEETIKTAKATITYAIIGLIFALISWIVINTVIVTLTK